jgi:hypothetical protein
MHYERYLFVLVSKKCPQHDATISVQYGSLRVRYVGRGYAQTTVFDHASRPSHQSRRRRRRKRRGARSKSKKLVMQLTPRTTPRRQHKTQVKQSNSHDVLDTRVDLGSKEGNAKTTFKRSLFFQPPSSTRTRSLRRFSTTKKRRVRI